MGVACQDVILGSVASVVACVRISVYTKTPKCVRSFVCRAMEYIQQNIRLFRKQLAFHARLI